LFTSCFAQDGKVYLLDRDDDVGGNLRCFDLSSGKELLNFLKPKNLAIKQNRLF